MGLFSKKSKTKSQSDPWDQVTPFLLGENGNTNLFGEAQNLFRSNQGEAGQFGQDFADASQQYLDLLKGRRSDQGWDNALAAGNNAVAGTYDTTRGDVANILGVSPMHSSNYMVDMNNARASQGLLDPTQALGRLLSGRPDTSYLDTQTNAIQQNAARNLMENVMPGLRSEAVLNGQYGGTRQGLAEGLAMSRLNQDLAPSITGMYANAYENAQGRMAGTADALNNQAYNTAFGNAANRMNVDTANRQNALDTQRFNANLGIQNNQYALAQNQANVNNRAQGLDMLNAGLGMQDQQYANYLNTLTNTYQNPQAMQQNNLNNYANLLYQGAGLGNQSVSKTKNSGSLMGNILGTAGAIGGLGMMAMGRPSGLGGI